MRIVNKIALSISALWFLFSVIPYVFWAEYGYYFWIKFNSPIAFFIKKHLSSDHFTYISLTIIITTIIIFLITKVIGEVYLSLRKKKKSSWNPTKES